MCLAGVDLRGLFGVILYDETKAGNEHKRQAAHSIGQTGKRKCIPGIVRNQL